MRFPLRRFVWLPCFTALLLTAGCSAMPDWLGEADDPPLPGERISLESMEPELRADEALAKEKILVPEMPENAAWPQALGNVTAVSGNLALGGSPVLQDSVAAGDGEAFLSPLVPAPVVAGGVIFAVDGGGTISAHALEDPDHVLWKSEALRGGDSEDAFLGGGLGYSNGVLYAVNDEGRLITLDAKTGKLRWRKELVLPVRSPPRLSERLILLLTADNQLVALDKARGEMVWSHRGINEIALPLHSTVPALRDGTVLVSYSSGEMAALDQESGSPLWSDTLQPADIQHGQARTFRHLSPLMAAGLSFASSSESIAAYETASGRRLWERDIRLAEAPWLAGNTLFFLTESNQVVAMRGLDGGIHWVRSLPVRDGEERIFWHGPVVAGGKLWLISTQGTLLALSPGDGSDISSQEIASGLMTAPVIAAQHMILLDREAVLHVLK